MVQQISYPQEIKDLKKQHRVEATSSLKTLHPFIDQEGLLRVGGRLQQSALPYEAIHQLILPVNHHFTKLVVSAEHIRLHHAGPLLLIASLREKFWIPWIRNVNTIMHQCLLLQIQGTGNTPTHGRATFSASPTIEAISYYWCYAGPILLKLKTPCSKIITKGYIAIFVCFATRAIHIEGVTSLTTEASLAALRRFIARRGKPRTVYSDNGTTLHEANQLHAIYDMLRSSSEMA